MFLKVYPVEKSSICWLGMFWSMASGLSWYSSWSCAGPKQLAPAQDKHMTSFNQLKPAAKLQNIPNQHMLDFSTG